MLNISKQFMTIILVAITLTACGRAQEETAKTAQNPALVQAAANANYSNVVACDFPQAPGIAARLATDLTQYAANNPTAFSAALSSNAYAEHCQIAAGKPGEENIRNGREVARSGNAVYYVVDRGAAALGFVKH